MDKTYLIPRNILFVLVGGFAGTALRFMFETLFPQGFLPWGTLFSNLLGCYLIGYWLSAGNEIKLILSMGFCGALTTMSAFAFENYFAMATGHVLVSILYIAISVIGGAALALLGRKLAGRKYII
ncbi:MAG: CrcB family protein [Micrococcaceae bacterium]